MKRIGTKSVFWLLVSSAIAIVVTIVFGMATQVGKGAQAVFADIAGVSSTTLDAYKEWGHLLIRSF